MFALLLRGGTLVDADAMRRGDLALDGGRIAAVLAPGEAAEAAQAVDVSGCLVLPGLVDAHAHLREPGLTHKEDFVSGTAAAALGGVTTVLDMPTDEPWTADAATLAAKMASAEGRLHVDVGFQAALRRDLAGVSDLLALAPVSVELFTADVPPAFLIDTLAAVTTAMRRLAGTGMLVGVSAGDQSLLAGSAGLAPGTDIAAFLASRPPLAEAGGVARAVLAAADTGARIHVRQINSALGVAAWRRLRDLADASVETTSQNLFFTAADYATRGAALKASPPLRGHGDVEALRQALHDGVIDIVATDHAPHSPAEKAAVYPAFADIPGGMPGLQTLLATMLKLVDEGLITLQDLARMCSANPAQRFGLGRRKGRIARGFDADLLVLDPRQMSTVTAAEQRSRAGYSPFEGLEIRSRLLRVFLAGRAIVGAGRLADEPAARVVTRQS